MALSFLPDFTSFHGTVHVHGAPPFDVSGLAVLSAPARESAFARVLDALSLYPEHLFPCCSLPSKNTTCTAEEDLRGTTVDLSSVDYMMHRYQRAPHITDCFPLCDDAYSLPCHYLLNTPSGDSLLWPAFKVRFRVGDWLDELHEASQGLLQEAVAKLRATLRVQFAARGVSAQESLEIHSGVRNPCPPSSLVRIAAVAANSILWNAGADMNSLADVVGIIFSDFTRGGAMDLLTGLGAKKRSDQSDPRLVVEAPFLSVVRIG
jgi:hypothetical protein